jgi:hypothetical protein
MPLPLFILQLHCQKIISKTPGTESARAFALSLYFAAHEHNAESAGRFQMERPFLAPLFSIHV